MRKAKDGTDTTVRKTESWKMNINEQLGDRHIQEYRCKECKVCDHKLQWKCRVA
jgi:lipopolysaccharide biosynthesis regulator YciM